MRYLAQATVKPRSADQSELFYKDEGFRFHAGVTGTSFHRTKLSFRKRSSPRNLVNASTSWPRKRSSRRNPATTAIHPTNEVWTLKTIAHGFYNTAALSSISM